MLARATGFSLSSNILTGSFSHSVCFGRSSPGIEQTGRHADHSPPFTAIVKNECSCYTVTRFDLMYVLLKACLCYKFYRLPWARINAFHVGLFAVERRLWPYKMRMYIMELEKLFLALSRKSDPSFTEISHVTQKDPSSLCRWLE